MSSNREEKVLNSIEIGWTQDLRVQPIQKDRLNREIMKFLSSCGCCGCCQPNQTTDRRFLSENIHKINAMLHQLLEGGVLAKGPCQQGVLHPDGAVRVGGVSPLLARAITVCFSRALPRKIVLGL
jgi:hypothetical protein